MCGPAATADRQTAVKVLIIAGIVAVNSVWIAISDFGFDTVSGVKAFATAAVLAAVAWFYRVRRPIEKFEALCTETALLLAFSASAATFSYLMTSINLPLVDKQLLSVDAALGFDWIGYVGFVNARPWLGTIFSAVYVTTLAQVALTVLILGMTGNLERMRHFVSAVMLGALICIVVSAILPSAGALGTLRPPADFLAKCVRHIRRGPWFWPVLVLNLAVILSTPVDGGHHLSDAIGGVLVALASWALVALVSRQSAVQAAEAAVEFSE